MSKSRQLQHHVRPSKSVGLRLLATFGVAAALTLGACTTATDPQPVATIQLSPGADSIEVGTSATLFVARLQDAGGKEIRGRKATFTSSNEGVATVTADGEVKGIAVGQATITATADGKFATATVRVILPVVSIVLTPDSQDVQLTRTAPISIQLVGPAGQAITGRVVTWASGNPSVATVSAAGIVTPVALGQTVITASAGGKSATAKIVVKPEPLAGVRIIPAQPVLLVRLGQTRQLAAECFNAAGQIVTGRTLRWFSNNPTAATVDINTGLVQGVALGTATISANCDGVVATVTVQVTQIPVSAVVVTPGTLTMFVGQQQQLAATARDSAGNVLSLQGRQVIWASNNLPVATVSAAGVVQGVSAGVAQVQVTVDGVASPVIAVTVQLVPVASIVINPNPATVRLGTIVQLTPVLRDATGNQLPLRPLNWRSLNTSLATVSSTGAVTGVALGTVTIEAEVNGVVGTAVVTIIP